MKRLFIFIPFLMVSPLWAADVPQIETTYNDPASTLADMTNVFQNFQQKEFGVVTSPPFASDLRPGQLVIVSTGIYQLCTNINSQLICWNSTMSVVLPSSPQAIKAFVRFDGTGTPSISDSYNVASVTNNGGGLYTVNFTNALPNANYTVSCMADQQSGVGNALCEYGTSQTASALGIVFVDAPTAGAISPKKASVIVFQNP